MVAPDARDFVGAVVLGSSNGTPKARSRAAGVWAYAWRPHTPVIVREGGRSSKRSRRDPRRRHGILDAPPSRGMTALVKRKRLARRQRTFSHPTVSLLLTSPAPAPRRNWRPPHRPY